MVTEPKSCSPYVSFSVVNTSKPRTSARALVMNVFPSAVTPDVRQGCPPVSVLRKASLSCWTLVVYPNAGLPDWGG
jgi:hypothetical protein